MRNDFSIGPGVEHILAAEFLWRTHTDEGGTALAKIHLSQRTSKARWPPPLHHVVGFAPGLPDFLDWRVEDARHNNIVRLIILAHRPVANPGCRSCAFEAWPA